MTGKKSRIVKLYSKYRSVSRGWFDNRPGKHVPWLNVSGVWLEKAGFKIGDAVEITVEQNILIIKNCSVNGDNRY